jgi:hypothetical protein
MIGKNDGLKVAMKALIQAIPNIMNVTVIMILFFITFGIILVS